MPSPVYRVEALVAAKHNRAGFKSASAALNTYIQQHARKDAERHMAAPFVMVDEAAPTEIVGYYTLSNFTVELAELPAEVTKHLPKYPRLPATLIGRLARGEHYPGTGSLLLVDALARAFAQTKMSGSLAVVVDAKDDAAIAFYAKHGFATLGAQPNRMFLSMGSVQRLFE